MNLRPDLKHALNYIVQGVTIELNTVDVCIQKLKRGKSLDNDSLTAKQLLFAHPSLSFIIAKLFILIIKSGYVPKGFGRRLSIPVPKSSNRTVSAQRLMILNSLLFAPLFLTSLNIVFCL